MIKRRMATLIIMIAVLALITLYDGVSGMEVHAANKAPSKVVMKSVKQNNKKIIIKWNRVSKASGYELYRKTNEGSFSRIKSLSGTTYTNTSVSYGNKYTYKVRAYVKDKKGNRIRGTFSSEKYIKLTKPLSRWDKLKNEYIKNNNVNYLLFVKYRGGSKADIELHSKKADGSGWDKAIACKGWVGKNGIDKKKAGDKRTPTGCYSVTKGFGIKSKPKTRLPYVKVTKSMYWCADRSHYNTLVDTSKSKHKCKYGEHLIDYKGAYDYGLFTGFNPKGIYGKGSAIFFHCTTNYAYTAGCISVAKENMLKIMGIIDTKTMICVYPK